MTPIPPEYRKMRKPVPKPGGPHRSRRQDLEEEDTMMQMDEWWRDEDEDWTCVQCGASEPPIFLCDAGWWCEVCYREAAGVPAEVSSDDLHDGINNGEQAGYIEALKSKVFEVEE